MMRIQGILAALLTIGLGAAELTAQRNGGGRNRNNARWNIPEEITDRIGMFFNDVEGPATDGDKVADLATVELVRTAMSTNQLSVLYLVDQKNEAHARSRLRMEWQLTANYELGIELRFFHCGRVDLGKSEALKERYAKKAPLFVAFSPSGKEFEVPMAGYRAADSKLKGALEKAAAGVKKPSIKSFAKKYGKLMKDYYELLLERRKVQEELAKAAGDRGKQKKAEKALLKLATEEQKILEEEQKQLAKVTRPERGQHRLGRPNREGGRNGDGQKGGGGEDGGKKGGGGRRGGN